VWTTIQGLAQERQNVISTGAPTCRDEAETRFEPHFGKSIKNRFLDLLCSLGMTKWGLNNDKAKWKKLAVESDGEFIGIGAVGVFGVADFGKLGESAKTARFASARRDELT
jgi:hypothetical protein